VKDGARLNGKSIRKGRNILCITVLSIMELKSQQEPHAATFSAEPPALNLLSKMLGLLLIS
jgi:hypothetical protein